MLRYYSNDISFFFYSLQLYCVKILIVQNTITKQMDFTDCIISHFGSSHLMMSDMKPQSLVVFVLAVTTMVTLAQQFDGMVTLHGAGGSASGMEVLAGTHYGNPFRSSCMSGEYNISISQIPGAFCSPTCSVTSPCPADMPSGMSASPECVLQDQHGLRMCAMICSPDMANPSSNGECGPHATCKPISGTGVCTYNN